MKILSASEALEQTKMKIYGKKVESFRPYLDKTYLHIIDRPAGIIHEALTILDFDLKDGKIHKQTPKNPFKAIAFHLIMRIVHKFSPK